MARINIEDEWFSDPRRWRLADLIKQKQPDDRDKNGTLRTDGLMVSVWFFAFKYWKKKELIPFHAWDGADFGDDIFTAGLAERRSDGVYVRGSSRQFSWYEPKTAELRARATAGGKARASNAKRDKKGHFVTKNIQPEPSLTQLTPSLSSPSSSSSSSSSSSEERNTTTAEKEISIKDQAKQAFEIWKTTLLKFRVPSQPMNIAQESSIARAIRTLGFETVCLALEGQRYETPDDKFDPRKHLSVDRVLHKNSSTGKSNWERLSNFAALERQRHKELEQAEAEANRRPS